MSDVPPKNIIDLTADPAVAVPAYVMVSDDEEDDVEPAPAGGVVAAGLAGGVEVEPAPAGYLMAGPAPRAPLMGRGPNFFIVEAGACASAPMMIMADPAPAPRAPVAPAQSPHPMVRVPTKEEKELEAKYDAARTRTQEMRFAYYRAVEDEVAANSAVVEEARKRKRDSEDSHGAPGV